MRLTLRWRNQAGSGNQGFEPGIDKEHKRAAPQLRLSTYVDGELN